MNRSEAIEKGEIYYNTGKPCRRGHIADRFTSNGSCRECLRIQHEAQVSVARAARAKRNNALVSGLRERVIMVSHAHYETVIKLCEIFQYSTKDVHDVIRQKIEALHETCPNPRVLNKDGLLKFIKFEGGQITNLAFLTIQWPDDNDPNTYVFYNSNRYDAAEVMEVLRGQRLNVRPK